MKATKHRTTFEGLPCNEEGMSMAYFGMATLDTLLEPIFAANGMKVERLGYNGVELRRGMTVGECGLEMRNNYGTEAIAAQYLSSSCIERLNLPACASALDMPFFLYI